MTNIKNVFNFVAPSTKETIPVRVLTVLQLQELIHHNNNVPFLNIGFESKLIDIID